MLHGIVVVLCHTILGHVLPAKLITLHDIVVDWTGTRTGPGVGWGGVSWGWAFSFLCFDIAKCAHGKAYAKQVRIMCVLSVPLLDQVQGILGLMSEGKSVLNTSVFDDFHKTRQK